jgi:Holliday junction resolvase RusA-like endonuclease
MATITATTEAVASRLRGLLTAGRLLLAVINTNPVVASRPRVGRWGTYYNKTYANWMKDAKVEVVQQEGSKVPFDGPCFVHVEQIVEKPRTSKLAYPRGDVDNYAKGPLDLVTKSQKLWKDDNQIVAMSCIKRFAEPGEQPRSNIYVHPLEG